MKKLVILRRSSQAFFLALFIYILWSTTYPLKGMLPPGTFFKINPYIMILTSVSQRVIIPGVIFGLIMLALTLVLGRFYCGWICPLGTLIDCAGALKRKKTVLSDAANTKIRKGKFIILGITVVLASAGMQVVWVLDPMVILENFLSLNLIPAVTGGKVHYSLYAGAMLALFLTICLVSLFFSRAWCRVACPLGATYALAAKAALLERRVADCVFCGTCRSSCRMGAIKNDMSYAKSECILCMDCIYECPERRTVFSFAGPKGHIGPKKVVRDQGPVISSSAGG